jgi:hypothetical protein
VLYAGVNSSDDTGTPPVNGSPEYKSAVSRKIPLLTQPFGAVDAQVNANRPALIEYGCITDVAGGRMG